MGRTFPKCKDRRLRSKDDWWIAEWAANCGRFGQRLEDFKCLGLLARARIDLKRRHKEHAVRYWFLETLENAGEKAQVWKFDIDSRLVCNKFGPEPSTSCSQSKITDRKPGFWLVRRTAVHIMRRGDAGCQLFRGVQNSKGTKLERVSWKHILARAQAGSRHNQVPAGWWLVVPVHVASRFGRVLLGAELGLVSSAFRSW